MPAVMKQQPAGCSSNAGLVFAQAARQAENGDLSVASLIGVAEQLRGLGAMALLHEIYHVWLDNNGNHALAFAVRFNFAVALAEAGDLDAARDQLRGALAQRPDFAPARINLGTLLERLDDRAGAVLAWQDLTQRLAPVTGEAILHRCTAFNQIGRVLEAAKIDAQAEASLRASLEIDPAQPLVIQHFVSVRQSQCTWPVLPMDGPLPPRTLLAGASPLSLAALRDDPVLQLAHANAYHRASGQPETQATIGAWPPPRSARQRPLRVGYVSSDFREHAVGYLTAELFELHDRTRVTPIAYYCGPARDDAMKQRFQRHAAVWCDVSPLSDRAAAARIVADGIDILIDLNGYTKDGRPRLFAYRPAPCIVNWLGYPGTTGSPHHHYIIADDFIIPRRDEIFYSEKVLRLPCYQPNDRRRAIAAEPATREQHGLPDDAFIFSAFNGPQKITPEIFTIWMDILHHVPGSVLWLLCPEPATGAALQAHAEAAGIARARLVLAASQPNAQHLTRFRLADLFLDTAPYGAHTTASDALWMGLPVLTCAGSSFASRVCGSLVRAANLPELVCDDWRSYRDAAIALAHDRPRLAALAARLRASRDDCALFDTPRLVRALEDLYESMWDDYATGNQPVPALHHLPIYHETGCDPGRPALTDRAAMMQWYRTQLAYHNAVQQLPADNLLWSGTLAA